MFCAKNYLTAIDISQNTKLNTLFCKYNQLTTLDINSNTLLQTLNCESNKLTSLDLNFNTGLTSFVCWGNHFQELNLRNIEQLYFLNCTDNPYLSTICVASMNQVTNNWTKDNASMYSNACIITDIERISKSENTRSLQSIYNLQGQQIDSNYAGLALYKYDDGTVEKVYHE